MKFNILFLGLCFALSSFSQNDLERVVFIQTEDIEPCSRLESFPNGFSATYHRIKNGKRDERSSDSLIIEPFSKSGFRASYYRVNRKKLQKEGNFACDGYLKICPMDDQGRKLFSFPKEFRYSYNTWMQEEDSIVQTVVALTNDEDSTYYEILSTELYRNGRLLKIWYPRENGKFRIKFREYLENGDLLSYSLYGDSLANHEPSRITKYSYNSKGRIEEMGVYLDYYAMPQEFSFLKKYSYDQSGRIVLVEYYEKAGKYAELTFRSL